jgi:uracil-DNA glycosylase
VTSAAASIDGNAGRDSLERLVTELGAAETRRLVNPYACNDPELDRPDGAARANLLAYLEERRSPALLLVGEAAGYRGCRFSGIAFTSERSLPRDRWSSQSARGWQEPSATIVHGTMVQLGLESRTLLWNAVPFHPAVEGLPLSNRTPSAAERRAGEQWLARIVRLTQPGLVVAVGRSAAKSLPDGTPCVRHPANGGAALFREQLRNLAREHGLA